MCGPDVIASHFIQRTATMMTTSDLQPFIRNARNIQPLLVASSRHAPAPIDTLNVDGTGLLIGDQGMRFGIRFKADRTITVVLATRAYGGDYASPCLASLVAARLDIPYTRVWLYYAGILP